MDEAVNFCRQLRLYSSGGCLACAKQAGVAVLFFVKLREGMGGTVVPDDLIEPLSGLRARQALCAILYYRTGRAAAEASLG